MIDGDQISIPLAEVSGVIREALREALVEHGRKFDAGLLSALASRIARGLYVRGAGSTAPAVMDRGGVDGDPDARDVARSVADLDSLAREAERRIEQCKKAEDHLQERRQAKEQALKAISEFLASRHIDECTTASGITVKIKGGIKAPMPTASVAMKLMEVGSPTEFSSERGLSRDQRQEEVARWAASAFGQAATTSLSQRGERLLEEAVETFQACGGDEALAHDLVAFVFARPPGMINQELGGVAVTVLLLAAAAGVSADEEECREIRRVLSKPLEEFTARNAAKNAAMDHARVVRKEPLR